MSLKSLKKWEKGILDRALRLNAGVMSNLEISGEVK